MLSIAKCQNLAYYERELVGGREDYLSEAGTAPGRWVGRLAEADGLVGVADRDALAAAFAGHHPGGGPLSHTRTTVTGFDLTLSPSKSLSLIWGLGDETDREQVEESLRAARDQVEEYLQAEACAVRRGHGGGVREAGTGFLGAVFQHRTSRAGDPGVHLHWVIFNTAQGPDGRRTALDGRALYEHRYTAEAVFQAVLRHELATRLGLVFDTMDRHGVAEVAGISPAHRRAFSQRRVEIEAEMARMGAHSGPAARAATLRTRKPKPAGISETELRERWRQQALDIRLDVSGVPRVPRTPTLTVGDDELATTLTVEHAAYTRHDVIRAVAKAARQGAPLTVILERADGYLASAQAVDLGGGRWTTPEMLTLERQVVAQATAQPTVQTIAQLTAHPRATAAAVAARPSLTGEQQHMVETVCSSGRAVEVVVGRAGTGKTFTLDAVRDAYETSGHRVIGAALAARAARELQAGGGIPSTTAHTLLAAVDSGRLQLRAGDVVVVDEAGMLGTRLVAKLLAETGRVGAKTILVGDPKQLPEVEAGGLFATLTRRVPNVTQLTENRRQHDPAERLAGNALRAGRAELAVEVLDDRGRLTVAHNAEQLRDQLVADWWAHRHAGRDVVMGAAHRADVADLNHRAHDLLEAHGQLGPRVPNPGEHPLHVGDRVLALKNRYDLGILNGDLATVTGGDDRTVTVEGDDGQRRDLPLEYVANHLEFAYARTIHKTQGLTCDVALLLGDDGLYAELGYTGLTRGTQENHLYTVAATPTLHDDGLTPLIHALGVSRAKTAAVDLTDPADALEIE